MAGAIKALAGVLADATASITRQRDDAIKNWQHWQARALAAEARCERLDDVEQGASELLAPFTGRVPTIDKYKALRPEIVKAAVERLDEVDREASDILVWAIWWRAIADNRAKLMCDQFSEYRVRALAAEARCERLEGAGQAVIQWWDSKLAKELARHKDFPWAEDAEWEEFNALRAALTEKDTEK